jgi:hypothetical protein
VFKEDAGLRQSDDAKRLRKLFSCRRNRAGIPPIPVDYFSKFGEIEEVAMTWLNAGANNLIAAGLLCRT